MLSCAPHASARGGCRQRMNQRMEARAKLARAGVPSKGRSGDNALVGGVVDRS